MKRRRKLRRVTALALLLVLCSGLALAQSAPDPTKPRAPPPQAALNLESLRNLTLRIERPLPGAFASGRFDLVLINEGAAALNKMTLDTEPIIDKDRRQLLAARLTADVTEPKVEAAVPARGTRRITLQLHDFREAGTFQTAVVIQSDDLPAVQRIPLVIEVTDRVPLPLLVIAMGVLLAFLVNQVAQRWRPREEQRYRIGQLRGEIERCRRAAPADGKGTLEHLMETLAQAEERSGYGALEPVRALLDEVEKGLAEYRKRLHEMRLTVLQSMDQLETEAERLQGMSAALPPDSDKMLDSLREGMAAVRSMIARGALDAANEQRKQLQTLAQEIQQSMPATEKSMSRNRGLSFSEEAPPAPPLLIVVQEPPDLRSADSELSLEFAGSVPEMDEVMWDFDDGEAPLRATGPRTTRRFAREGDYLVKASVRRGGSEVAKAILRLALLPRRSERALGRIRTSLAAADWALFAIALVLATLSGWMALCDGKVFGTGAHYITAFFWGFGINSSVRGVTDVFKRVTAGGS